MMYDKWFIYPREEELFPFYWDDKYLLYFDDECAAENFIYQMAEVCDEPGLVSEFYAGRREIHYLSEEKTINATNVKIELMEVRRDEEHDWDWELHLVDENGVFIV